MRTCNRKPYLSAAEVNRDTWFSVKVGVSWSELAPEDVDDAGIDVPKLDEILDSVLKLAPMLAVPVMDDGLNVWGVLNGLRECAGGSGLNAILDESAT